MSVYYVHPIIGICGMIVLLRIKIYIWHTGQICSELVPWFKGLKDTVTHLYNILQRTTERQCQN
jgi:hypothetical protein